MKGLKNCRAGPTLLLASIICRRIIPTSSALRSRNGWLTWVSVEYPYDQNIQSTSCPQVSHRIFGRVGRCQGLRLRANQPNRPGTRPHKSKEHKNGRTSTQYPPLPPDDLKRNLTLAQIGEEKTLPHIGLVGDTYTITVTGAETEGRFCVIDMHIPPGGGPPPHRHDFEETFILLDGEMEATFRGKKTIVKAGDTVHIPANAPHQFHNTLRTQPGCSASVRLPDRRNFSQLVGTPVATRTTPPPKLDEAQQAAFMKKVMALAPKYRTELLKNA